jgi:hypothetical protein
MMKRVWLDHGPKVSGATIHPKDNMPPYPRDSSEQVQEMALLVMLDIQERAELVIRLIQLGIDLYSISLENGDAWRAYGGFGSGRKWPIIFAGMMLDDPDMQRPPETIAPDTDISKFGEDGHTYYGQPTTTYPDGKPLWGQDCVAGGYGFGPYWVNHDCRDPNGILEAEDMENGGAYRLCCTSHTWVGQALAARIMRGANLWGWPPFFQYVERWINETGNYGGPFVEYMWTTYAILYTIASGVEGWNYYD